jgi:N4-gp56 family major capsid protein
MPVDIKVWPGNSAITGTPQVAGGADNSAYISEVGYNNTLAAGSPAGTGYTGAVTTGSSMLGPAIQTIWSKEILFQAMPNLRFEQFAVKKTELGVMPGLQVNFMRYNNLPIPAGPLVDGVRMRTYGLSAQQYQIKVAEHGFAVAVSELLLNASFDDIMASASRLLGRNMAMYIDSQARTTLQRGASVAYGYSPPSDLTTGYGIYNGGTAGAAATVTDATSFYLTPYTIKDAVEALASKNVPRLGETYVTFVHPHQARRLRDTPEWIEVTKYAQPGNFMLGEIGRINDVVFIETTQISQPTGYSGTGAIGAPPAVTVAEDPSIASAYWRTDFTTPGQVVDASYQDTGPGVTATPGWGNTWPNPLPKVFDGLMIGDNAFGHAISLPVELRDGGVLDFGREHALAWYGIWGFGVITDSAVVRLVTN